MTREIKLYQISHKTYAIALRNIYSPLTISVVERIKKCGGQWNHALNQFQLPICKASAFIKEIKNIDQKISIQDVPVEELKKVMVGASLKKKKWNRFIVLDPLLFKRFQFVMKYFISSNHNDQSEENSKKYKRVLILCQQSNLLSWKFNKFQKSDQLEVNQIDYRALLPDSIQKLKLITQFNHQIQILTYSKLRQYGDALTIKALQKYTSIVFDDADLIFNDENDMISMNNIGGYLKEVITNRYKKESDLIFIFSKLNLAESKYITEFCNFLKPKQFGKDQLKALCGEVNDISWMRKRYRRQNKVLKQFFWIITSTVLLSISQINLNSTALNNDLSWNEAKNAKNYQQTHQNKILISIPQNSIDKFKALDNRYKHINCKNILTTFQNEKSRNSLMYSETSKLQEAKYLRELRQMMLQEKIPTIFKTILKFVKELKLKIAIVIQSFSIQDRLQKFLAENQIGYCHYEINFQILNKSKKMSMDKFNLNSTKRVCILNRDKLLKQYKKAKYDQQKYYDEEHNRRIEEQLNLEHGAANELLKKKEMNDSLFGYQQDLDLQKITTVRHLFLLDTFWYEFNEDKESIIRKILNAKLPQKHYLDVNQIIKKDGVSAFIEKKQQPFQSNHIQLVKHYFIFKDSYQKTILDKYNVNVLNFEQNEASQEEVSKMNISCQDYKNQNEVTEFLLELQKQVDLQYKDCERMTQIYDIDDEFDRIEFEAMKERERRKALFVDEAHEQYSEQKKWNTSIDGLEAETPCLRDLVQDKSKLLAKRTKIDPSTLEWLQQTYKCNIKQEESSYNQSQNSEMKAEEENIDLHKYIVQESIPKQINSTQKLKIQQKMPTPQIHKQKRNLGFNSNIQLTILPNKKDLLPKQQRKLQIIDLIDDESPIVPVQKSKKSDKKIKRTYQGEKTKHIFKNKVEKASANSKNANHSKFLWKNPSKTSQKIIAKKYKNLRIKLVPFQSSLL